ncbi:MAG: ATP-binding protein [Planctomycetaceae bacterium]
MANGDFQYRAELNSGDEMNELADVFNQITAQFYQIKQDLDRKVQEKTTALIRSERLAGVGFLASGVAHEINKPLHVISTVADSLEMQAMTVLADVPEADRETFTKYLGMIQTEAFRCQEITEKLLSFARGQEVSRADTDLTRLTREVVGMVSHLGKFSDRHIKVLTDEPIRAEVNAGEIKQVVLNMISNALEAMDSGGTLEIELTQMKCHAYLTFRDDGCGLTEDVQKHLFDPFFTQRKGGGGTGLGLSISHRIVQDHNGGIDAYSAGPGKGTTFRIRIPKKVQQTSLEESSYEETSFHAA